MRRRHLRVWHKVIFTILMVALVVWSNSSVTDLKDVKNTVIEQQIRDSKTTVNDIYVYRYDGGKYVYTYKNDKNRSQYYIDCEEAKEKLDRYIETSERSLHITILAVMLVLLILFLL